MNRHATGQDDQQELRELAQRRVGRALKDKWQLDALIGVGGMAAVYAATHRNGKRAAVKILHPGLSHEPRVKRRFLREGYVANKVGHRGAVEVLDDDVDDDGSVFLVMELLEGESLQDRLDRVGTVAAGEVLAYAEQLLETLVAAHGQGIVHRDLKPDNVFITSGGEVKVLDFGIARLREVSSKTHATATGVTMGTPAFMPPEQARGLWEEVDGRSDVWAVGATMFVALTGRDVHQGRTVNEMLLAAMTKPAPELATLAPQLGEPVCQLVDRALAFDMDDRWAGAADMLGALRAVRASLDAAAAARTSLPLREVPVALAPTAVAGGGDSHIGHTTPVVTVERVVPSPAPSDPAASSQTLASTPDPLEASGSAPAASLGIGIESARHATMGPVSSTLSEMRPRRAVRNAVIGGAVAAMAALVIGVAIAMSGPDASETSTALAASASAAPIDTASHTPVAAPPELPPVPAATVSTTASAAPPASASASAKPVPRPRVPRVPRPKSSGSILDKPFLDRRD